jgi:hypothetical protein
MKEVQEVSLVYQNTTKRMKDKGLKFLSDLEPKSFMVERIEYWTDKNSMTYVLELLKNGSVTVYKEFKI